MNDKTTIFFTLLLLMCWGETFADELHLVVSGKAFHIGASDLNDENYGLGFEYDFEERDHWIRFTTGAIFKDSNDQTSRYFGFGSKRRFRFGVKPDSLHVDMGLLGFVMTRKDYRNNRPFVGALPFASVGNDWVALNIAYVPKISPKMFAFWYLQATFKLAEF